MALAAADALEITDIGQGSVFGLHEEAFCRSMQECQFLSQQKCPALGQGLNKILQHGPQSPGHLDALAAEVADFRDGELDEILPVRSPIHEPKPARGIVYPSFVQVPVPHTA